MMNSKKARWAISAAVAVAGALSLGGCMVRARAQPGYYGARGGVTVQQQPVYQQQAQPVYQQPQPVYQQPAPVYQRQCGQCVQGVGEVCNGCDDNCNGVVDEGC